MDEIKFEDLRKALSFGVPTSQQAPAYKGKTVYRDMADNLSKIPFDVIVTEGYNPNVHWSMMGYDTDPQGPDYFKRVGKKIQPRPIFDPSPAEIDVPCRAKLTGDFIIDALVSGQKLSFVDPDDMHILADWIEKYLKSYEIVDLTRFPDRKAFNENAKKALSMLRGNLVRKSNWEEEVRPSPLTLAEIIANL